MAKYLRIALLVTAILVVFTIGASAKIYVIDNMDDVTPWTGSSVTQETENIKEGTGAVKSANEGTAEATLQMSRKFETPMDLSAYEDDGVISFWIYIEDIDAFVEKDNSLEFTSSGTCDVEESAITLDTYWFENGWNQMFFTMDDFATYDANWSAINYIRFYKFTNPVNYWIIDDMKIGMAEDFGIGKVKVSDSATLIESFDNYESVDTAAAIEGTGAATVSGGSPMIIQHVYETPMDLSRIKENGYVYFWLYVEDAAAIHTDDGQFELTSSGECDKNELSWIVAAEVELKDGWNEILLPVKESDCDLSAVNFLRIYLFSDNAENTMKLDKLMVGVGEDFGIMPETEPPTEPATEPVTEPTGDSDTSDGETTAASGDDKKDDGKDSDNSMIWIIIGAAAAIVIIVIVVIVVTKKKKK